MSARRAGPAWWAALAIILIACGAVRLSFLERTLPYPLHFDEARLGRSAADMLRDGTANPQFFQYPSLPIYLTTGAFAVGLALDDPAPRTDPGDVGLLVPYYTRPDVVRVARVLFIVLGVLAMGLAGVAAWLAFGEPALLLLVPLLMSLSNRFLLQSWTYLNVDIVGAFVCAGALAYFFATDERRSALHRAVLPGLLTGFAVGSKYYLGLVGLPFAIALLADRQHLVRRAALIVACTLVGFLLTTPYALLDRETFAGDVGFELAHYGGGHRRGGGTGDPGWPQLLYYAGQVRGEFGAAILAVAAVGTAAALRAAPRRTLLFLSFPLALLLFLCSQRVHFSRNLTSIHALLPALAGVGILTLVRIAARGPRSIGGGVRRGAIACVLVVGLLSALIPWRRVRDSYSVPLDARRKAVQWVLDEIEPGRPILISTELQVDVRPLLRRHPVALRTSQELLGGELARIRGTGAVLVLVDPAPGTPLSRAYAKALHALEGYTERGRFGEALTAGATTVPFQMGNPRLLLAEIVVP